MIFKNMNASIWGEESWQREIIKRVEAEYSEKAVAVAAEFAAAVAAALEKALPGYAGVAIDAAMRKIPRYEFIKAIEAEGSRWDAQIDLLLHEVSFIEIYREAQHGL